MVNMNYIRTLIKKHGYTLKPGISKAHWSRILAYKHHVRTKTMVAIMDAFPEADVSQIFLLNMFPNGNKEKGEIL